LDPEPSPSYVVFARESFGTLKRFYSALGCGFAPGLAGCQVIHDLKRRTLVISVDIVLVILDQFGA